MGQVNYNKNRADLVFNIFDRFPNLSNRGTAFILVRDYPEYFKNLESARGYVRYYRGSYGNKNRDGITIKKYLR